MMSENPQPLTKETITATQNNSKTISNVAAAISNVTGVSITPLGIASPVAREMNKDQIDYPQIYVPFRDAIVSGINDSLNRRWLAGYLTAVSTLVLCLAQAPSALGDSASCMANISSYVTELDALLSKERNTLTPYTELNERHFPFRDCEADALLEVVRRSSFIRSIGYHSGQYFIHFSSEEVVVGFTYYVAEKKTDPAINTAGWVHK